MDDFAISREAVEDDTLVVLELDHHVLDLPVDVPSLKQLKTLLVTTTPSLISGSSHYLHGAESPGLQMVTIVKSHAHDLVGRDAKQLILFLSVKSDDKQ